MFSDSSASKFRNRIDKPVPGSVYRSIDEGTTAAPLSTEVVQVKWRIIKEFSECE